MLSATCFHAAPIFRAMLDLVVGVRSPTTPEKSVIKEYYNGVETLHTEVSTGGEVAIRKIDGVPSIHTQLQRVAAAAVRLITCSGTRAG